jgi:hypothetical protein
MAATDFAIFRLGIGERIIFNSWIAGISKGDHRFEFLSDGWIAFGSF